MHGHVSDLARSVDPPVAMRGTSVTISGSGLDWHDVATYLQPNGIGKYTAGLDPELATFPQTVAADTVYEYFGH